MMDLLAVRARSYVTYEQTTGRIVYTGMSNTPHQNLRDGHRLLLDIQLDDPPNYYIDQEGAPIAKPAQPSPHHVFDYGAKKWVDTRPLSDLQATAHTAIERWRDTQETGGLLFTHAAREWDGGLVVRSRLQPMLGLDALPTGFFWTDAANADVPIDKAGLAALNAAHEQALVLRGFQIHARQRAMKNALDAMTRDELLAFAPGWPIEPITTGDQ